MHQGQVLSNSNEIPAEKCRAKLPEIMTYTYTDFIPKTSFEIFHIITIIVFYLLHHDVELTTNNISDQFMSGPAHTWTFRGIKALTELKTALNLCLLARKETSLTLTNLLNSHLNICRTRKKSMESQLNLIS